MSLNVMALTVLGLSMLAALIFAALTLRHHWPEIRKNMERREQDEEG